MAQSGPYVNFDRGLGRVPIALGLHTDLDKAAKLATREMIDFLVSEKGMKGDAYISLLDRSGSSRDPVGGWHKRRARDDR
jgi:hypothetical protein